jgi:hypothetical protein
VDWLEAGVAVEVGAAVVEAEEAVAVGGEVGGAAEEEVGAVVM